jgi:hypothetical protein
MNATKQPPLSDLFAAAESGRPLYHVHTIELRTVSYRLPENRPAWQRIPLAIATWLLRRLAILPEVGVAMTREIEVGGPHQVYRVAISLETLSAGSPIVTEDLQVSAFGNPQQAGLMRSTLHRSRN